MLDNAYSEGLIDTEVVGISFEPTTEVSVTNGELTFGGVDSSKYTGDIAYVPVTTDYVGITQTVTYGSAGTSVLSSSSGITDTGTTLLYLATGGQLCHFRRQQYSCTRSCRCVRHLHVSDRGNRRLFDRLAQDLTGRLR